jgi:hypothetical protein
MACSALLSLALCALSLAAVLWSSDRVTHVTSAAGAAALAVKCAAHDASGAHVEQIRESVGLVLIFILRVLHHPSLPATPQGLPSRQESSSVITS